ALVFAGLLARRCIRAPTMATVALLVAVAGLTLALGAQAGGYAHGFDQITFRAVQLGAQLIAPLALAWALAELTGKSMGAGLPSPPGARRGGRGRRGGAGHCPADQHGLWQDLARHVPALPDNPERGAEVHRGGHRARGADSRDRDGGAGTAARGLADAAARGGGHSGRLAAHRPASGEAARRLRLPAPLRGRGGAGPVRGRAGPPGGAW